MPQGTLVPATGLRLRLGRRKRQSILAVVGGMGLPRQLQTVTEPAAKSDMGTHQVQSCSVILLSSAVTDQAIACGLC